MKLYEAIRLGSMLHPQTFDHLEEFRRVYSPNPLIGVRKIVVATCAMGAAFKALGITNETEVPNEWRSEEEVSVSCPTKSDEVSYCGDPDCSMSDMVMHLNDTHRWTREKIADWLEPIEEAKVVAKEEVLVEVRR